MKSINPQIEWSFTPSGNEYLKFTFEERLSEKEAELAILEWREAFQSRPDKSIVLVWDCRKMKSYDVGARTKWIMAIKEMKSRIAKIWLIADSITIKVAATIIGKVTSFTIKSIRSEDEIVI